MFLFHGHTTTVNMHIITPAAYPSSTSCQHPSLTVPVSRSISVAASPSRPDLQTHAEVACMMVCTLHSGTGRCLIERQLLLVRAAVNVVIACLPLHVCPQPSSSAGCRFKSAELVLNHDTLPFWESAELQGTAKPLPLILQLSEQ